MAKTAIKGAPAQTIGNLPAAGTPAPAVDLTTGDLGRYTLADAQGKWTIMNIFPSLDTPVCAASVRRFNTEATSKPNTTVLCISMDLPFAQKRFCAAEGIRNVTALSAFRSPGFGRDYGVLLVDSPLAGLLARALVVVDPQGVVRYTQLVPEITHEPDYAAALGAIPN